MKFYLLKMKISGIKNIDKEIELSFYKKVLQKKFNSQNYNVKAIYGANGAGKTGIIYAAEIYKKFVTNSTYLTLHNENKSLLNLINQNKRRLTVEMTFAVISEDCVVKEILVHFIEFGYTDNKYVVSNEKLSSIKGLRINDESKFETIYEVKEGLIVKLIDDICAEQIADITKNLLSDRSFGSIIVENLGKINKFEKSGIVGSSLLSYFFAQSLTVILDNSDRNYIDFKYVSQQVKIMQKYHEEMNPNIFRNLLINDVLSSDDTIAVEKSEYQQYEKNIKNLCKFLQVFKNDLNCIKIEKEEKADEYICKLILMYDNGTAVSRKYESTGIKKLMNLYYALCCVENGGIVFIDEFDANIHDIILIKLVDYIRQYTKGQFIFTTHNLGPMEVLQKDKCSIDFLSMDSQITSWVKIGNCSAASVYRKGLIKYSPFNIEAFSFLGVFGDVSNE